MTPRLYRVILPVSDIERAARIYGLMLDDPGERDSPGRQYFDCRETILACDDPAADGNPIGDGWQPRVHFRRLLKVHSRYSSRYGLHGRSPALRGLCHGASIPPAACAKRPVSYRPYRPRPASTWMESSSTGDPRPSGALRIPG